MLRSLITKTAIVCATAAVSFFTALEFTSNRAEPSRQNSPLSQVTIEFARPIPHELDTFGRSPTSAEAVDIRVSYSAVFGAHSTLATVVGSLENGKLLKPSIKAMRDSVQPILAELSVEVRNIEMSRSGRHATLEYRLLLGQGELIDWTRGSAVRNAAGWLVTQTTMCELLAVVQQACY